MGKEFRNNLFTSHFNTGRILRHRLVPHGGSYQSETEDFVTATQGDVHFNGCPRRFRWKSIGNRYRRVVSRLLSCFSNSKPQVKGAIYRVSRAKANRLADPYGNSINWKEVKTTNLIQLLSDARSLVCERAVYTLSKRGEAAIKELRDLLKSDTSTPRQRQYAVWALCRSEGSTAREAIRTALDDADAEVRQSALHAVALHRDTGARARVTELLRDSSLHVRCTAAHALGRIGQPESVPSLFEAIALNSETAENDRFVEHALIYAIIEINHTASIRIVLNSGDSPSDMLHSWL